MPRSEEANGRIKDDRQQQILSAALKVFIHKGFAAAKMSDIADQAGVSYGLVYHYFASKDEVYRELVHSATDIARHFMEELESEEEEPVEKLHLLVERAFRGVTGNELAGNALVFMMQAMTSGAYPVQAMVKAHNQERAFDILVRITREGQEKGQFAPGDPAAIVLTFFSAVLGLACLRVAGTIDAMPDPEIIMRVFGATASVPEGTGRYHA